MDHMLNFLNEIWHIVKRAMFSDSCMEIFFSFSKVDAIETDSPKKNIHI